MNSKLDNKEMTAYDEISKLKAAYALNLCTVSVSQIVDYQDINILEQEYELILNNLNLQNMPKDQALLHVLKQILDTVTFFRVAEGDKKMIEKKYQQKVKNAIWNAIPSFGLIAVGNPYTFAVSMIASVGMGYMNYRKEKAKMSLEREEQEWQLQRTAIEQFNALRRELFDTAWRLADTYDFDDNYRLTESQIAQYNKILMDSNVLRKYERLESIKDNFGAYPPFWYHIANASKDVADMYRCEPQCEETLCAISKYTILAEGYYRNYISVDMDLLRVNYTRAACDLEYAALLMEKEPATDSQEVIKLIDDAISHCGSKMDVLQIAAIYYLKLHEIGKAEAILRKLVIEDYNTKTNSQMLSFVYLQESVLDNRKYNEYTTKYKELIQFVDRTSLMPWVDSRQDLNENSLNEINNRFISNQKELLDYEFECIVNTVLARQAIAYNKQLYKRNFKVGDSFFEDTEIAKRERQEEFSNICGVEKEWQRFVSELSRENIMVTLDEHMNVLLGKLARLSLSAFDADIETVVDTDDIKETLTLKTAGYSVVERLAYLEEKITNGTFDFSDYKSLSDLMFSKIMHSFVENYKIQFEIEGIGFKDTYNELASVESNFAEYCQREGLPTLEELMALWQNDTNIIEERKFFDLLSCFKNGKNTKERKDTENRLQKIFTECEDKSDLFDKAQEGFTFTTDPTKISQRLKEIKSEDATKINKTGRILAFFHDHKEWYGRYVDLYFMRTGIYSRLDAKVAISKLNFYSYKSINIDRLRNELYIEEGSDITEKKRIVIYQSDKIKLDALYDLIKKAKNIVGK